MNALLTLLMALAPATALAIDLEFYGKCAEKAAEAALKVVPGGYLEFSIARENRPSLYDVRIDDSGRAFDIEVTVDGRTCKVKNVTDPFSPNN